MNWVWHIRNFVRLVTGRETLEEERFRKLLEIRMNLESLESKSDPLYRLISDFTLDSIVISRQDGSVVVGNGGSRLESVKGSALFEYIKSELPDASYIMVKTSRGVRVIYSDGEYIYIARASGYVSPLEMKLIAKKFRSEGYAR